MHATKSPDPSPLRADADVTGSNPSTDELPEICEAASGAPPSNDGQPGTRNSKLETPSKEGRRRRWQKFVRRGRPSTFNEEVADAMYESILEAGVTDSRAGLLANVSTSTVSRWKQEDPGFADFLETARTHFEFAEVKKIRHAKRRDGQPNAQNAKWLLQHTNPEVWGGRSRKCSSAAASRSPVQAEGAASGIAAAVRTGREAEVLELGRVERGELVRCGDAPAPRPNDTDHDRFAAPQQSNTRQNIPEIDSTNEPASGVSRTPFVDPEWEANLAENEALRDAAIAEIAELENARFCTSQQSKSMPNIPEIRSGKVGVLPASPSLPTEAATEVLVAGRVALGESNLETDLQAIFARRRRERKALSRTSR
jgi:hypothetical protein